MSHHLALTSAIAMSGMGIYGYMSKGSIPSMIGGVAIGTGFATSYYLVKETDKQFAGHVVGALSGGAALAIGSQRAMKLQKGGSCPLNAVTGCLIAFGLLNAIYQTNKAIEWKGQ